ILSPRIRKHAERTDDTLRQGTAAGETLSFVFHGTRNLVPENLDWSSVSREQSERETSSRLASFTPCDMNIFVPMSHMVIKLGASRAALPSRKTAMLAIAALVVIPLGVVAAFLTAGFGRRDGRDLLQDLIVTVGKQPTRPIESRPSGFRYGLRPVGA